MLKILNHLHFKSILINKPFTNNRMSKEENNPLHLDKEDEVVDLVKTLNVALLNPKSTTSVQSRKHYI